MYTIMSRYRIYAPSTHDTMHEFSGMIVLAPRELPATWQTITVYPLKGKWISMECNSKFLTKHYGDENGD